MRTKKVTTNEATETVATKKETKRTVRKTAAKKVKAEETQATAEPTVTESVQETQEQKKDPKPRTLRKKRNEAPVKPQQEEQTIQPEVQQENNAAEETKVIQQEEPQVIIPKQEQAKPEVKVFPLPKMVIRNIVELTQAPQRAIILTDQQIQTLTLDEIEQRHKFLEETLANVLDYDVVISDTNIWLELLVGHSAGHPDPRSNTRLQFERQLEFISKMMLFRGGKFMIMGETYEEIDRFATILDPTNHREADWTDNVVCLNAAARLAKKLILAQQKENRLRIEGIGAESHHASFADPAIVRKVADLFAEGKKVLLLTNDASVAIRSIGICDDLQRHNNISDAVWDEKYAPLRPMVFTFDDLKLLDNYTRQYHYIQMASGKPWMADVPRKMERSVPEALTLWQDAFRPGDKHRGDNLFTEQDAKQAQQKQQQNQQKQAQQKQQQNQQKQAQQKQQKQQQQKSAKAKKQEQPAPQQEEESKPIIEQPVEAKPEVKNEVTATVPVQNAQEQPAEPQKPRSRSRRRPQKNKQAAETPQTAQ